MRLEDKLVITRVLVEYEKIKCVCVPYPTKGLVGWGAEVLHFSVFHTRLHVAVITYNLQVRTNPPIRFTQWSGDKNIIKIRNHTRARENSYDAQCRSKCLLCPAQNVH